METFKYRDELKQRTKMFALRVIKVFQSLPKTTEAQIFGKQLLRSATSIAANYLANRIIEWLNNRIKPYQLFIIHS